MLIYNASKKMTTFSEITVVITCAVAFFFHYWHMYIIPTEPSVFMNTITAIPNPFQPNLFEQEPDLQNAESFFTITDNSKITKLLTSNCSVQDGMVSINVTITWLDKRISYSLLSVVEFAPICKYYSVEETNRIGEQPCHCSPFNVICRTCDTLEKRTVIKEKCVPFKIKDSFKNALVHNATVTLIKKIQQLFDVKTTVHALE